VKKRRTSPNKRYRILSLDGGGIRGLMTAVWLDYLEQKLGSPLNKHFDLIAGTSTGSILACGIAMGMRADSLIELYLENAATIFPGRASRLWSRAQRLLSQGPSAPKYDGQGLEQVLQKLFRKKNKNVLFGELITKPVLVFTYDTLNRQSIVFKNTKREHVKIPVYQICKASSSAPTYFPAHVMRIGKARVPLIDGGVVANNPTACAIAEAIRINKRQTGLAQCEVTDFIVASFGTGEATRSISIAEAQEWGALEWAIPIIDVLFDGSTDAVDYIARHVIDDKKYFRFQCKLEKAYDDMDNADKTNLNALIAVAQNYLETGGGEEKLQQLVKFIQ
jgi:patatin-like phospholipase/acyl hydrolase